MALNAERVVTELIADTSGHDPKIRTSAQVVEQAASQIERAATRAEGAVRQGAASMSRSLVQVSGSSRAGMQQLGFQISDIAQQLSSGTNLGTIFAQQSSQVIQAFQLMGGGGNRFLSFLSGPWGIGVAAAATVLLPFIARMFDTRTELQKATDELTENARKAEITREAHEAFSRTIPGVIAQIRSETEALEQQNHALRDNAQATLDRSRQRQSDMQGERNLVMLALRQAREDLARARAEAVAPGTMPDDPSVIAAQGAISRAEARIQQLDDNLARIDRAIALGQREIIEAEIGVQRRRAEALADPIAAINQSYNAMAAAAERAAEGNRQLRDSLDQTLASIERQRQAALRAQRESQREQRTLVRPVTGAVLSPFGQHRDNGWIHRGVDLRGHRGDPVVAPASGWARQRMDRMTRPGDKALGLYVEIVADDGTRQLLGHLNSASVGTTRTRVTAGQVIGTVGGGGGLNAQRMPNNPNDGNAAGTDSHLHWQVMRGRTAVDPMRMVGASGAAQEAEQAAREAAQLAERRLRDEAQFQEQLAGLSADLLNARRREVQTEEESADADIAAIRAEQAARAQRIRNEAAERSRRDPAHDMIAMAEAQILLGLNRQVADARIEARNAVMRQRIEEQRLEIAQRDLRDQTSVLQARGQMARTAMERRDIELRLLALQHREELLAIEKQRAQQGLSAAQRAQLDRAEAAANERYGLGQQTVMRQTAGPLEAFLNAIPHGAREMDEALQEVAVHGLAALNDGLAQAATRFLHLGGIAGDILNQILSDLIRIGLQQAELAAFGGGNGGGGGGLFGALGRVLGISGAARSGGNWFDVFGPNGLTGHASGYIGPVGGVGGMDRNILSINGQPRARVSGSETLAIIPQGKSLGFNGGRAAMGGGFGPPQISVHVDARDAVLTHTVRAWVREGIEEATMRGSAGGASYLTRRAATVRRQTL